MVDTDVAAPDDPRSGCLHGRCETRGLGIVKEDDVPSLKERREVTRARGERSLVEVALLGAECAIVAAMAMQVVVEALCQFEVFGPLAQDDPTGVDTGASHVGEQGAQHLRDPTSPQAR